MMDVGESGERRIFSIFKPNLQFLECGKTQEA